MPVGPLTAASRFGAELSLDNLEHPAYPRLSQLFS